MKRLLLVLFAAVSVMVLLALGASAGGWMDGARVRTAIEAIRNSSGGRLAAALAIAGLLAADLVLPTPSSVLMTLAGALLGPLLGATVSFAGAMAAAIVGYTACRRFGRAWFRRTAGADAEFAERVVNEYGAWAIVLSRSVPMLTELISCAAGLAGMPPGRFIRLSTAGTLPLCLVYGWAGAQSAEPLGLRWAVLLALVLPAAGLAVLRIARRTSHRGAA
ncbi:MAG: VTT domain-containing protein [Kiritimatiellae bacterium]|nr:VTT domain-containing protein [Kiritimatiellia bacterium]